MKNQMKFSFFWAGQACFFAAAVLLSAGYASVYGWAVLLAVSVTVLVWYEFRWSGWRWISSTLLVLDVVTAVVGVQLGNNPAWMIAGAQLPWRVGNWPGSAGPNLGLVYGMLSPILDC